jgi:hypothetical protein
MVREYNQLTTAFLSEAHAYSRSKKSRNAS